MKLNRVKDIIKEEIRKMKLNENLVCSTETVSCQCTGGLPSQGSTTCSGTKTNYCNGGHSTDCMCCSDMGRPGGGDDNMMYKRKF